MSTIEPVDEDRRLDNCHHGSRLRLHLHLHRETEDGTFTEIVIRNRPSRYEKKCQGFSGHDIRFLVCRTGGGQTCLGSFCMPGRSGGFPPRIPYRHRSSVLGAFHSFYHRVRVSMHYNSNSACWRTGPATQPLTTEAFRSLRSSGRSES